MKKTFSEVQLTHQDQTKVTGGNTRPLTGMYNGVHTTKARPLTGFGASSSYGEHCSNGCENGNGSVGS